MFERIGQGIDYFGAQISTFKPGWLNRSHVVQLMESDRTEKARLERQISSISPNVGHLATSHAEYEELTEDEILKVEVNRDYWLRRKVPPGSEVYFLEDVHINESLEV